MSFPPAVFKQLPVAINARKLIIISIFPFIVLVILHRLHRVKVVIPRRLTFKYKFDARRSCDSYS